MQQVTVDAARWQQDSDGAWLCLRVQSPRAAMAVCDELQPDKQYVAQIRMNSEQKKKDLNPAKKEAALSNEQLASVCLHNGQPYISAAFFDRAENMAVSDKGKEMMAQTGDKSVAKLPVRNEQKQKTPSPILLKAAAAIRGR